MPLLELKGYGVRHGAAQVDGIDLTVEPGTMLAVVSRDEGVVSLLALAMAGLLPRGAVSEGRLSCAGSRVLYLDRHSDVTALTPGAELIVADEPGRGRDPATQLALLGALQAASRTAAVMLCTADFRMALGMGLEVAAIAGGKLMLRAPASQIAEQPQYNTVRTRIGGTRLRARTLARPPIGEPLLEIDVLARSYRRGWPWLGPPAAEALAGIELVVRHGEMVGILGPEGAGKSTLLRLIAGLERPNAGRVRRRQGLVGYVFSDPRKAFNPTLPVGMSLTEPLHVEQTLLVEEQADRLVEVVRAVGLEPDRLARLPGELGVAELQRMALARALAGRPNLMLLDDPTACLDPEEAREFLAFFARLRADFGVTAILASREFEVVRAVADRLVVLDAGRIVEAGRPGELAEAPQQEITRRLVSPRYPAPYRPVEEPAPAPAKAEDQPAAAPPQLEVATVEVTAVAPTPGPVEDLTFGLSAQVVIAPIVLPDPTPVAGPEPDEPAAVAPSENGADEAAESRQAEVSAEGLVDAARGAEAPDGKAAG